MRLGILAAAALFLGSPAYSQPAAPDAGTIVKVNGIDLHYREMGSGDPLLLIHGFGSCGMDSWGDFTEELSKHYRLIIVDQRGHGGSTGEDRFSHRASADDMLALLDHLKIARTRAMGISSGGMTLYHVATKAPGRLSALVTIGATDQFEDQARQMLAQVQFEGLPPFLQDMYRTCARRGPAQISRLVDTFRGFSTSKGDMNLTPADLARVTANTLIIHGDRDHFFPVAIPTRIYAAIPKAQLWIVPNGDHVPIYGPNEPEFLRVVLEFLKAPAP
jgi:pimeloyl-ACP methyl ester carboxylesterase